MPACHTNRTDALSFPHARLDVDVRAVDKLNTLHTIDAARGSTPRRESKRFQGKNKDLDALHALCAGYERFIVEVVAPRVAAQWDARNVNCDTNSTDHRGNAAAAPPPLRRVVFQRQPCLRVSPPKPGPSGRRHRDRDYNHQPGQVNYWLPLAPAAGHNTLWVETVRDFFWRVWMLFFT